MDISLLLCLPASPLLSFPHLSLPAPSPLSLYPFRLLQVLFPLQVPPLTLPHLQALRIPVGSTGWVPVCSSPGWLTAGGSILLLMNWQREQNTVAALLDGFCQLQLGSMRHHTCEKNKWVSGPPFHSAMHVCPMTEPVQMTKS